MITIGVLLCLLVILSIVIPAWPKSPPKPKEQKHIDFYA
jgi:hypothetical protein